jgi:hypothetical protein
MTGRGEAASGHIPVSSWNDRTRPIIRDRTLTASGFDLPGKLRRMTGRGGGYRDRTRWSTGARPVQRPITRSGDGLQDDRTRWWSPGPDAVVKQHCVRCSVRSSVRSLFFTLFHSELRRDFSQSSSNSKRHR